MWRLTYTVGIYTTLQPNRQRASRWACARRLWRSLGLLWTVVLNVNRLKPALTRNLARSPAYNETLSVAKSFCNFAQSTAVILHYTVVHDRENQLNASKRTIFYEIWCHFVKVSNNNLLMDWVTFGNGAACQHELWQNITGLPSVNSVVGATD